MRALRLVAAVALALTLAACSDSSDPPTSAPPGSPTAGDVSATPTTPATTVRAGAGTVAGQLADGQLTELSGLAGSRDYPGVFWAHNDSGDAARVFAVREDGTALGTFAIDAEAIDWEDIAVGPGATSGASFLYIGDIGDNTSSRPSLTIYRVVEPDPATPSASALSTEAFMITYPDGPADAEALAVDPLTGDLYIVTKALFSGRIYRAPAGALTDGASVELELIREIATPGPVTAADISPDGQNLLIRTYFQAVVLPGGSAEWRTVGSVSLDLVGERQGESIAFTADGNAFITSSEGAGSAIYRYEFAG